MRKAGEGERAGAGEGRDGEATERDWSRSRSRSRPCPPLDALVIGREASLGVAIGRRTGDPALAAGDEMGRFRCLLTPLEAPGEGCSDDKEWAMVSVLTRSPPVSGVGVAALLVVAWYCAIRSPVAESVPIGRNDVSFPLCFSASGNNSVVWLLAVERPERSPFRCIAGDAVVARKICCCSRAPRASSSKDFVDVITGNWEIDCCCARVPAVVPRRAAFPDVRGWLRTDDADRNRGSFSAGEITFP